MNPNVKDFRILLLDDDPFILKFLGRQLVQLGFEHVVACERASDALAQFMTEEAKPIDLVISDLQMPEMDGVEFVRQLVQRGYAGDLLLLSGEDERTVQAAARLAKAQGLNLLGTLAKPIELESLRQKLDGIGSQTSRGPRAARKTYAPEELRLAITQGQLINHYQPKVALADGALIGVESLVRWQHPQDGLVFPDQFITVAEQHGLIDALTHAVLGEALRQVARWKQAGLTLQVAVNISMDNLHALDFPEVVMRALTDAGVGAESLILEVTESRLLQDPMAALDILTRLRLKRVTLSIDDFGTGHSSLAQLRDLPFDELKLDMSFVHGAHLNATQHAILEASATMARQLGMKTVAEGIEDRDDWDTLRKLGCNLAQGYFCAKPMAGADLSGWLDGWRVRREDLIETPG